MTLNAPFREDLYRFSRFDESQWQSRRQEGHLLETLVPSDRRRPDKADVSTESVECQGILFSDTSVNYRLGRGRGPRLDEPTYSSSLPLTKKTIAFPSLPALAVLPQRWLNTFGSCGGSTWMTQSTSGRSRPRAATSVQMRTSSLGDDEEANDLNVASRRAGVCCPWKEWIEKSCNNDNRRRIYKKKQTHISSLAYILTFLGTHLVEIVHTRASGEIDNKLLHRALLLLASQDPHQLRDLLPRPHDHEPILQRRRRASMSIAILLRLDLHHDPNRVPQAHAHELPKRVRHRRAEQARAPLFRQTLDDPCERGGEAEVEQAVRFVQDEHLEFFHFCDYGHARLALGVQGAGAEDEFFQTPGRADEDRGS
jgi:hypothetical protein